VQFVVVHRVRVLHRHLGAELDVLAHGSRNARSDGISVASSAAM
jgi:hypothetical protein